LDSSGATRSWALLRANWKTPKEGEAELDHTTRGESLRDDASRNRRNTPEVSSVAVAGAARLPKPTHFCATLALIFETRTSRIQGDAVNKTRKSATFCNQLLGCWRDRASAFSSFRKRPELSSFVRMSTLRIADSGGRSSSTGKQSEGQTEALPETQHDGSEEFQILTVT
jgi:hypothetical protein